MTRTSRVLEGTVVPNDALANDGLARLSRAGVPPQELAVLAQVAIERAHDQTVRRGQNLTLISTIIVAICGTSGVAVYFTARSPAPPAATMTPQVTALSGQSPEIPRVIIIHAPAPEPPNIDVHSLLPSERSQTSRRENGQLRWLDQNGVPTLTNRLE